MLPYKAYHWLPVWLKWTLSFQIPECLHIAQLHCILFCCSIKTSYMCISEVINSKSTLACILIGLKWFLSCQKYNKQQSSEIIIRPVNCILLAPIYYLINYGDRGYVVTRGTGYIMHNQSQDRSFETQSLISSTWTEF